MRLLCPCLCCDREPEDVRYPRSALTRALHLATFGLPKGGNGEGGAAAAAAPPPSLGTRADGGASDGLGGGEWAGGGGTAADGPGSEGEEHGPDIYREFHDEPDGEEGGEREGAQDASDDQLDAAMDQLSSQEGIAAAAATGLSLLTAAGIHAPPEAGPSAGLPSGGSPVAREKALRRVWAASPELFEGCTVLMFLLAIVSIMVTSSWSQASVDRLLRLQKNVLRGMGKVDAADALPGSWPAARRLLQPLSPPQIEHHGCRRCGSIFTGTEDLCPGLGGTCLCPRFILLGAGKKRANFVAVRTLSLEHQLHMLVRRDDIGPLLGQHAVARRTDGLVTDILGSASWSAAEKEFPCLAAEPRHLRLALFADGVCPFAYPDTYTNYWFLFEVLNLPAHLRRRPENLLVWGMTVRLSLY